MGSNPTAVNLFKIYFCSFSQFDTTILLAHSSPERIAASMATRTLTNRFESRFLIRLLVSPSLFTSSRSLQTLAYEEVRTSSGDRKHESTALILHGLLGSGRNWRSFSRSLASSLSVSSPSGIRLPLPLSLFTFLL